MPKNTIEITQNPNQPTKTQRNNKKKKKPFQENKILKNPEQILNIRCSEVFFSFNVLLFLSR